MGAATVPMQIPTFGIFEHPYRTLLYCTINKNITWPPRQKNDSHSWKELIPTSLGWLTLELWKRAQNPYLFPSLLCADHTIDFQHYDLLMIKIACNLACLKFCAVKYHGVKTMLKFYGVRDHDWDFDIERTDVLSGDNLLRKTMSPAWSLLCRGVSQHVTA